jgi:hypothetical protein
MAATLQAVLSESEINELGKATGQCKRLRVVTPFRLLMTLLAALGEGATESIADLCREFNYQNGTNTAYKAFYMRLARPEFVAYMKAVVARMVAGLGVRVIEPEPDGPLARFADIVIQDGSSFALKASLSDAFPGRFKNVEPAAVEIHATYSGFADGVIGLGVSPDTTQERAYLPDATEMSGKLVLGDRGYPSRAYFTDLDAAGASFIMRLSRSFKPYVRARIHENGVGEVLPEPIALPALLEQRGVRSQLDLDIELRKGKRRFPCRLLVLPGKSNGGTRLCTNLPRDEFPVSLVAALYSFRWQVELLFKEWKSYANLRKFDTGNEHIAEGLIWASLAAAILKRFIAHATQLASAEPISTRKVAMCARLFLRKVLMTLMRPRRLRATLRTAVGFLGTQARRAHPRRDRKKGRQSAGLVLRFAA